jgi:serine/threonine-protein kinase
VTDLQGRLKTALADRYTIERELGHGGMAVVFLAQDQKLHREVALKVLRPDLAASLGPERFLREIEIAANLTHPNVLGLHDCGEADGLLFYTMPYVEGESLRQRLNREGELSIDDALGITGEVADALAHAHSQGIVHRDIKPENILFESGHAVVADFGIARAVDKAAGRDLTSEALALGTPAYMAPEQGPGAGPMDGRADLYALGCVLHEMLCGEPPYTGPTPQAIFAKKLGSPLPKVSILRDTIPQPVEDVVGRLLQKTPADRYASAEQLLDVLDDLTVGRTASVWRYLLETRRKRRWLAMAAGIILIAGAGVATTLVLESPSTLVENRIAIAPFDVYDDDLSIWEEGLIDILSSNLDGAGPLRTVPPSMVINRWSGRAVLEAAVELGLGVDAGFVLYGRLLHSGGDSLRLSATLVDVAAGRGIADFDLRQHALRVDHLTDSLTVGVVQELGIVGLDPQRSPYLGAATLGALKDYLRGEYFLRRTQFDSAAVYYGSAIRQDSTFALAYSHQKTALWSELWALVDTAGDGYALRAGQLNHGLSPRDSLLITVDSLWASLSEEDSLSWSRMRRLFETLDYASEQYPLDPWVWYKIGEARWHLPLGFDYTMEEELEPFDRAIALDSSFALAYFTHPVELALILEGPEEARRYLRGYQLFTVPSVDDSAGVLAERLLDASRADDRTTRAMLDRASTDVLYRTAAFLDMWFDPAETAVMVARLMVDRNRGSPTFTDPQTSHLRFAQILSVRGRLAEAYEQVTSYLDVDTPDDPVVGLFADLALLGAVPEGESRAVFDRWLEVSPRAATFALPWWASRGEVETLQRAIAVLDSVGVHAPSYSSRVRARCGTTSARAYLALAGQDTTESLHQFAAIPDSLCPDTYLNWKTHGELLLAQGDLEEARRRLTKVQTLAWNLPTFPLVTLMLGRTNEGLGNREQAIRWYRKADAAWVNADPLFAPYGQEARDGLRRLENR